MKSHHMTILIVVLVLGWVVSQSSAYQAQEDKPVQHFFDQLKVGQSVTFEAVGNSGVAIKWNRDHLDQGEFKILNITSEYVDLEEPKSGDQFRLSKYFVATLRMTKDTKEQE